MCLNQFNIFFGDYNTYRNFLYVFAETLILCIWIDNGKLYKYRSGKHTFNILLQYLVRHLYAKCFPNKCLSNIKIFDRIYKWL